MFFSCLTVELTRLGPNLPVENVFIFKIFRKKSLFWGRCRKLALCKKLSNTSICFRFLSLSKEDIHVFIIKSDAGAWVYYKLTCEPLAQVS